MSEVSVVISFPRVDSLIPTRRVEMQYRRAAPRDTVASSFVHQHFCAIGRSASLAAFPRGAWERDVILGVVA